MNAIVDDILQKDPAYRAEIKAISARAEAVAAARAELAKPLPPLVPVDLAAQIADSGVVPDDLVDRLSLAARDDLERSRSNARGILDQALVHIRDARARAAVPRYPAVLTDLGRRLDGLLEKSAAACADLGSITTMEEAFRSPAATRAFATMTELAEEYRQLREAQVIATAAPQQAPVLGISENYDDVRRRIYLFGLTREMLEPSLIAKLEADEGRIDPVPWPGDTDSRVRNSVVPSADPVAYLKWLTVTPGVTPWMPSADELRAAERDYDKALTEAYDKLANRSKHQHEAWT